MTPVYDDSLLADLATLDDEFVDVTPAERGTGGGNNVPNGTYHATIDRIFFDRTKDGTKILLKWELLVATGEYAGEKLYRNNMTTTPDNLRWLKADLLAAGVNCDGVPLSQIPGLLETIPEDALLEVNVKRSGAGESERVNVYINKRVDREGGPGGSVVDAAPKAQKATAGSGGGKLTRF